MSKCYWNNHLRLSKGGFMIIMRANLLNTKAVLCITELVLNISYQAYRVHVNIMQILHNPILALNRKMCRKYYRILLIGIHEENGVTSQ